MVLEPVCCPHCPTTNGVNADCARASFILDYPYRGYVPEVEAQVSEMAMNGSGIRDTARVLRISPPSGD